MRAKSVPPGARLNSCSHGCTDWPDPCTHARRDRWHRDRAADSERTQAYAGWSDLASWLVRAARLRISFEWARRSKCERNHHGLRRTREQHRSQCTLSFPPAKSECDSGTNSWQNCQGNCPVNETSSAQGRGSRGPSRRNSNTAPSGGWRANPLPGAGRTWWKGQYLHRQCAGVDVTALYAIAAATARTLGSAAHNLCHGDSIPGGPGGLLCLRTLHRNGSDCR